MIDQVAVSVSVMVVVTEPVPRHSAARGAARSAQRNRVLFGAFHQAVGTAPRLITRLAIGLPVAGVGQRAGAGIEAQSVRPPVAAVTAALKLA